MEWLDPESICTAINDTPVELGPGYIDGPASRDVEIEAVVTCIDTGVWLSQALGDDELDASRTVAQVVVGQAAFADVLVLTEAGPGDSCGAAQARTARPDHGGASALHHGTEASGCTVAPRPVRRPARFAAGRAAAAAGRWRGGAAGVQRAQALSSRAATPCHRCAARRGGPGTRTGPGWRANPTPWCGSNPRVAASASATPGAGWRACPSVIAPTPTPERTAMAASHWDERFGDRHIALTVLVCGANPRGHHRRAEQGHCSPMPSWTARRTGRPTPTRSGSGTKIRAPSSNTTWPTNTSC